jgi:hypothetical protein
LPASLLLIGTGLAATATALGLTGRKRSGERGV